MKSKIIGGVVVVLVLAVFVGNWMYGKNVAKEIDKQLQENMANNELPVSVSYSQIVVNPMFSKVILKDFKISDIQETISLECEAVQFKLSSKEALRMAEEPEVNELNSFEVQFKDGAFKTKGGKGGATVENITIDFDGHLTKADFENMSDKLPSEKQALEISFSNLEFDKLNIAGQQALISEIQKQFSNLDEGKLKVVYNPDSKEISIKEFSISSPTLNSQSDVLLTYSGNSGIDFKMLSADVKSDYTIKPIEIHLEQGDNTVDFSLTRLAINTDFIMNFEKPSLPVGRISFLTEGLKANSKGGNNAIISLPFPGASIEELDIERLAINYELKNESLKISDTELISSIIGAALNADIRIDAVNTQNSTINSAKLIVNKLSPELEGLVAMIEGQMGKKLPREDNKISLEIIGTLGSPKIKGLE